MRPSAPLGYRRALAYNLSHRALGARRKRDGRDAAVVERGDGRVHNEGHELVVGDVCFSYF